MALRPKPVASAISVYLIALAVVTFIATMAAPETAGKPLS
jgi:hypothetical protein